MRYGKAYCTRGHHFVSRISAKRIRRGRTSIYVCPIHGSTLY